MCVSELLLPPSCFLTCIVSFNRKVLKRIDLSDGTHLPAGSFISVPTYSLARDEQYYENPLEFKPFRFYEMRQKDSESEKRHQFASTSPSNLPWGYGKGACPGRTFAACEIKLICALLISQFDLSFPDKQTQRPENVYIDERITPSRSQEICFRAREPQ
jgi:cytochrome P450